MGVDFAEFASSNRPPTSSELEELKEILAPDEARLIKLEQDIKASQEETERLIKEKAALLKKMKAARSAASWIRRMPTEIMEAIFLYARGPTPGFASLRICDAPLVLLRVCRLWREIAVNTPKLWSSMNISIPANIGKLRPGIRLQDERKRIAFEVEVDRWLQRSASQPLSIRMRKGAHLPRASFYPTILSTVLLKLVAHSQRWESLDFEAQSDLITIFSEEVPLPLLKRVRISDSGWHPPNFDYDGGPTSILDCPSPFNSPSLHRLILLTTEDSPQRLAALSVNWASLTALTIGNLYNRHGFGMTLPPSMITGLLPILTQCVTLRQFHISLPICPPALPETYPLVSRNCEHCPSTVPASKWTDF
ncbi:hypothetical protein NMY22_g18345 [Coprinellus aureogranulatus]|nr:hypothetical protein NMY22_g18345 [Coprinellus aureogranulatus]